jgi:hypothetical protein
VLVGVGWICFFFDGLYLGFPGHFLSIATMRVYSGDEEAAAIVFYVLYVIAWWLFLLKRAGVRLLLLW